MNNIKMKAWQFLIDSGVGELPINVFNLSTIDLKIKILSYSEGYSYIEFMSLVEYAKEHKGFSLYDKDTFCIFYDDNLSFIERNFVISHEIGHIVLGHIPSKIIVGKDFNDEVENEQEKEADIFSYALLAPSPVLAKMEVFSAKEISEITNLSIERAKYVVKDVVDEENGKGNKIKVSLLKLFSKYINSYKKLHKKNFLKPKICMKFLFIIVALTFFSLIVDRQDNINYSLINLSTMKVNNFHFSDTSNSNLENSKDFQTNQSDIQINSNNPQNEEIIKQKQNEVYITKTGKKYHSSECRYLKDKEIIKIKVEDAENLNLQPCLVCKPND